MKHAVFFCLMMAWALWGMGQLNCETRTEKEEIITTCYHKNRKPSTVERWDKAKRTGNMKGYDAVGKEIFNYSLRSFAGHASVYLKYHPNGQVSRCEYSSAPDGGIQFYQMVHTFDENGVQTSYVDLSQPDGHPVIMPHQKEIPGRQEMKKPELTQPVPPANECAVPMLTVYRLKNRSGSTVNAVMKSAQGSQYVPKREMQVVLRAGETLLADSVLMGGQFLSPENSYSFELTQEQSSGKRFEISYTKPLQSSPQRRVLTWIITEE